jgi:hypothetical protein
MTTASVSSAPGPASGDAATTAPDRGAADGLARLRLVLDRELVGVRRHGLELAGRVPDSVRPHVDAAQGMLEFLLDDGAGGVVVLALAPGARGDTVVPLLPAAQPAEPGGRDVTRDAPFDEVVGEALEDVSRLLTHVERPDEMRGLVLHLGGRMLMVYADLWELRVTLLP